MLVSSILFLLISNAVTIRRDKSILYSRMSISILVCCFFLCLNNFYLDFYDKGIGIYGGLYISTIISQIFHLFTFIIINMVLLLTSFYPRKLATNDYDTLLGIFLFKFNYLNNFVVNKMSEQYRIIEYSLIILFILLGGIFLMSSSDLVSIFISIEFQSYGLYILCVLYRNSERATSGGLTYFLLGGLSSCFILLGSGLLYANCGNTTFDGLYIVNNLSNVTGELNQSISNFPTNNYESFYINFSFVVMSVGFLFKISAAPFHFWSPDVYDAIPTIVTTFVAVFAKISIFVLLLELVHYTNNLFATDFEFMTENNFSWTFTLLISSTLSLIIGSVLGLTQFRIKRLYAYSTISHVGFMLLALAISNIGSVESFLFYLIQYSISNLNAFMLLVAVGYSLYMYVEKDKSNLKINKHKEQEEYNNKSNEQHETSAEKKNDNKVETNESEVFIFSSLEELSDKNNSPVQLLTQMKGYFYINPIIAISLSITLFSFIGIPPLIGFFAKQMVLSSAIDNGYIFMAFVAILTSVISAYYYLVLIKQIFFSDTDYVLNPQLENLKLNVNVENIYSGTSNNIKFPISNIQLSSSLSVTISILTLIILLFILNPQEWLNMVTILSLTMFNV